MKKYIVFLLMCAFAFVASAQSLTHNITLVNGATYYKYTGVAADTLTTAQDSIVFTVLANNEWTTKVNVGAVFTKVSGNDTTVTMRLRAKYFDAEDYGSVLAIATSANVTSTTGIQKTMSYGTATGYRYYKVSLQLLGMKSKGVHLKSLEIKFVQQ